MADSVTIKITGDDTDFRKKMNGIGEVTKKGFKIAAAAVAGFAAVSIKQLADLAEETREYREDMAKLEAAFTTAGFTTEQATKAYKDMFAVLGEEDRSVETVNHLAQLCDTQKELETWTTICTGVLATFGDSLPIEGLTEAANETAKVGKVVGPLADALNWAGVSEDAFNESLAKCSTEQERQALITETLNGLYTDAAKKYNEINAGVMDANRAQSDYTDTLAALGTKVEPIMTALKVGWTHVLGALLDLVKGVDLEAYAEKIVKAIQSFDTKAAINHIANLMKTIKNLLPIILTVVTAMAAWRASLTITTIIKGLTTSIKGCQAAMLLYAQHGQLANIATTGFTAAQKALTLVMGVCTGNIKLAAAAQTVFNTVLNANPIGLVIAAIAALSAGLTALMLITPNAESEQQKLYASFQSTRDAIKENTEAYNELKEAQEENITSGIAEFDYLAKLKNELDAITDKNGKIKEGYESRAAFIVNELKTATGTEISLINGVIQGYDELSGAIDKAIEKKRAEIIMSTREDAYKAALANLESYKDAQSKAYNDMIAAEENYNKAKEDLQNAGNSQLRTIYLHRLQLAESEYKNTKDTYDKSVDLIATSLNDIRYYEEDYAYFLDGNYDRINQSRNSDITAQFDYQTAKKEDIKKYIKELEAELKKENDVYKKTGDQSRLEAAINYKNLLTEAEKYLENLEETVEDGGESVSEKHRKMAQDSSSAVKGGLDTMLLNTQESMSSMEVETATGTTNLANHYQNMAYSSAQSVAEGNESIGQSLLSFFSLFVASLGNMKDTVLSGIAAFVLDWAKAISNWWKQHVAPWFTTAKWLSLFSTIKTTLVTTLGNYVSAWNTGIGNWWTGSVLPWFTVEKWKGIFASIVSAIVDKIQDFKNKWAEKFTSENKDSWWGSVKNFFSIERFKKVFEESIVGGLGKIVEAVKTKAGDIWNEIKEALKKPITVVLDFLGIGGGEGGGSGSGALSPYSTARISQGFKPGKHNGIDYACKTGTPIQTPVSGRVTTSKDLIKNGKYYSYGRYVVIRDTKGNLHYFAHMSRRKAVAGQPVVRGATIGYVGSTGNSTGPHLHYEVRHGGKQVNPKNFLKGYKTGGFPSPGELFIGNEDGIELMGKMGNKNVIANNMQIIEGIKQGLFSGMVNYARAKGKAAGNVTNINQEMHFHKENESPSTVKRAAKKGLKLGLAGGY